MHREYNHFWRQINVIYSSFLARILLKCSVNYSLYTLVIKKFKPTSNDLGTTTLIELRKKWKLSKFLQTETTEMVIRFTGWHFFFSFYSITYITEITFLIQDMWLVNINYRFTINLWYFWRFVLSCPTSYFYREKYFLCIKHPVIHS